MARIPILRFGSLADSAQQLNLTSYKPQIDLQGVVRGVDNVRHDVFLSAKFCDEARAFIAGAIARHGDVLDLGVLRKPQAAAAPAPRPNLLMRKPPPTAPAPVVPSGTAADFKRLLTDLLVAALNRA